MVDKVQIRVTKKPIKGVPAGKTLSVSKRDAAILVTLKLATYVKQSTAEPVTPQLPVGTLPPLPTATDENVDVTKPTRKTGRPAKTVEAP